MDTTPRLALPYIMASQAQKHVTHNEAIRSLDALVQTSVGDRDLSAPPASPAEGDCYIVPAGATADWSGHEGAIAAWQDGAWQFHAPQEGWLAWVADEDLLVAFDGSAWVSAPAASALQNVPMLGINATADSTSRLALSAAESLFNHAGAGHRQKINKNAAADTASQLYQTSFSGRAELGTTGDDDFHLKVSADGSIWHEAMVVDKDNGKVGFGTNAPACRLDVNDNAATPPAVPASTLVRFAGADAAQVTFMADAFANNGDFTFRRADNTAASPAAVASGANLGQIGWVAYDGTSYSNSQARIEADAAEAWTASAHGTHMDFAVTPTGSTTRTKRLRIHGSGNVAIRDDLTPVCKLDVDGPVRVKSYTVATVPAANAGAGQIIYVSNETGGAVLAFSDGTNWRRVTDRNVIA